MLPISHWKCVTFYGDCSQTLRMHEESTTVRRRWVSERTHSDCSWARVVALGCRRQRQRRRHAHFVKASHIFTVVCWFSFHSERCASFYGDCSQTPRMYEESTTVRRCWVSERRHSDCGRTCVVALDFRRQRQRHAHFAKVPSLFIVVWCYPCHTERSVTFYGDCLLKPRMHEESTTAVRRRWVSERRHSDFDWTRIAVSGFRRQRRRHAHSDPKRWGAGCWHDQRDSDHRICGRDSTSRRCLPWRTPVTCYSQETSRFRSTAWSSLTIKTRYEIEVTFWFFHRQAAESNPLHACENFKQSLKCDLLSSYPWSRHRNYHSFLKNIRKRYWAGKKQLNKRKWDVKFSKDSFQAQVSVVCEDMLTQFHEFRLIKSSFLSFWSFQRSACARTARGIDAS